MDLSKVSHRCPSILDDDHSLLGRCHCQSVGHRSPRAKRKEDQTDDRSLPTSLFTVLAITWTTDALGAVDDGSCLTMVTVFADFVKTAVAVLPQTLFTSLAMFSIYLSSGSSSSSSSSAAFSLAAQAAAAMAAASAARSIASRFLSIWLAIIASRATATSRLKSLADAPRAPAADGSSSSSSPSSSSDHALP
jgi:hypothetical protein